MSLEGVTGVSNLLVYGDMQPGQDETDAATIGGQKMQMADNAAPSQVDRSVIGRVKNFFAARRDGAANMLSNFAAVAGRKLDAARHMLRKPDQQSPANLEGQKGVKEEPSVDPARTGATLERLNENLAFIDEMSGETGLPPAAKDMIAQSPTLMTHLKKYADKGYKLNADTNPNAKTVAFDTPDFDVISVNHAKMQNDPKAAVGELAKMLIASEGDRFHDLSATLAKEGLTNKDDPLNFEAAVNDPFGPLVSKADLAEAHKMKDHFEQELKQADAELSITNRT
ncbi:hypothetical protein [Yoonia sp. BS5-3]|uniref:YfdX protein n=1 Tax=Yoonia phaeophyticola TaxID=3137369 RepID=A0ABZ2V858_9RHOB